MAYFMNKYYDEDKIYRYLDELCCRPETKREAKTYDVKHDVEQVTYEQTKRVLGLLVGPGGNPIGYEIHPGNTDEGHTIIHIIENQQQRFGFPKPIVVADAGLLSKENIRDLEDGGYEYILGARIRSQS